MRKYAFNSFVEVVENTKNNIDSLKHIVDVLHTEFQAASDITDQGLEYRKKQLDQLIELNETVQNIVDMHPAQHIHDVMQLADNVMSAIVEQETDKNLDPHRAQWGTPVNMS
jgi:hypothetical protein